MSNPLSDLYRTAFVSGASTGLGKAFAEMLLADGVLVWGTAREKSRLAELQKTGGEKFVPLSMELAEGFRAEAIFNEAEQAAGGFDVVINNAGYGVFGDFATTEFRHWEEQIQVMLVNTARLSHAAVRRMRERGTHEKITALVNISSLAAEFPLPYQSAYNVCKAGLTALNESLMVELANTSIIVIDFRPGDYRTEFEGSVRRPGAEPTPRMKRAWGAFNKMMATGPTPDHAANALRRALLRQRSGTVRTGRVFQAVIAPFIARLGSLGLRRRIQASYFDIS